MQCGQFRPPWCQQLKRLLRIAFQLIQLVFIKALKHSGQLRPGQGAAAKRHQLPVAAMAGKLRAQLIKKGCDVAHGPIILTALRAGIAVRQHGR